MLVLKCNHKKFHYNLECWSSISETDMMETFEMLYRVPWVKDLLISALRENHKLFQNYFLQLIFCTLYLKFNKNLIQKRPKNPKIF